MTTHRDTDLAADKSKYQNFGNVGAMGDSARSDQNSFVQGGLAGIDLGELAKQLALVRLEMNDNAPQPDEEQKAAISAVVQAEAAAKSGDKSKAVEFLKGAGKWTLDVAKSVAASLVKDVIEGKF